MREWYGLVEAVGRKVGRGLVVEPTVWTIRVVLAPVLLAEHLGLERRGEHLAFKQFAAQRSVERFDVAVLPGRARFNVARGYSPAG